MKTFLKYVLGMLTVLSLSNCANGKRIQEKAPVALQSAYFTLEASHDSSSPSDLKLYIPTAGTTPDVGIQLDSIYFRGMKAEVLPSTEDAEVYVASFEVPEKARDFVMSSDPREEYCNQVPIKEKIPFELRADEAMLVFTKEGKSGYYKIEGISERESGNGTIKRPENIRH